MNESILIVEDDPTQRQVYSLYLKELNYQVTVASSVGEAVQRLKESEYDLILTDKNLPGADKETEDGGMCLLRYVQKNHPGTDIIIMTGYATIETVIEAMRAGVFDYLVKPFKLDVLGSVIARYSAYREFLNPEGTIDLYKKIHNDAISIIEGAQGLSVEDRQAILKNLEQKIDHFFKNQKIWESVIIQQRDALTSIGVYAEELRELVADRPDALTLVRNIIDEVNVKI